uniref:Uncharacterized protein n=1 Tax=Arundo donax TaxID=35708 RepID=A0A0A9AGN4_ARUDO
MLILALCHFQFQQHQDTSREQERPSPLQVGENLCRDALPSGGQQA